MNDETTKLDQADEEILTYTVSDEALEAAADTEKGELQLTRARSSIATILGCLNC